MISFDEALEATLKSAERTRPKSVKLEKALDLVLAEDIVAPFDLPRFDNSAVDGYAVVQPLKDSRLRIARTIGAGDPAGADLKKGECVRIFTGARLPTNAFGVVMQEDTISEHDGVQICITVTRGLNVRRAGEEIRAGDAALHAGTLLNSAALAAAAQMGYTTVPVFRPPKVGLVITGAELILPGKELGESQIYESNSSAIKSVLRRLGIIPKFIRLVGDEPNSTREVVEKSLKDCDILITTGGVSVGDRDVVKDVFEELGVRKIYWKVAVKPGKPVYFGKLGRQAVFGLPGNSLSVLATTTMLVIPYLMACMGFPKPAPVRFSARLLNSVTHKTGRREFVPGKLEVFPEGFGVNPILGQGSHMLLGMAQANSWIDLSADVATVDANESVWVIPFGDLHA